jgi:MFS family permease
VERGASPHAGRRPSTGDFHGREEKNRMVVASIVASQFAMPFMFSGVAVALPHMGTELDAGATALSLVVTLFLAGSAAFLLPLGRLADATDKAAIYKLALLGFALTSGAIGLMSWMPGILAMRLLQGVTTAGLGATGPALVADQVPPERRGRAYGAMLGAVYVGLTLGPICAGALIRMADWRAVFLVGGAIALLAWLGTALILPSRWRRPTNWPHASSTVIIVTAIGCLVAGSATLHHRELGFALMIAGVLLSVVFVQLQRRLEDPLLDVRALAAHRVLRSALLVQMLIYTSGYCSVFVLSIYLQVSLGHPAETAGLLIGLGSLLMAVTAPIAGFLADRVRANVFANLGVTAILICSLMATALDANTGLGFVAAILVVHGLGYGLFASPNMTMVMNSASPETLGQVSALSAKARALGMIAGVLIGAVLISVELGNAPVEAHPSEVITITVAAFRMLALIAGLALMISLPTGRANRRV